MENNKAVLDDLQNATNSMSSVLTKMNAAINGLSAEDKKIVDERLKGTSIKDALKKCGKISEELTNLQKKF